MFLLPLFKLVEGGGGLLVDDKCGDANECDEEGKLFCVHDRLLI